MWKKPIQMMKSNRPCTRELLPKNHQATITIRKQPAKTRNTPFWFAQKEIGIQNANRETPHRHAQIGCQQNANQTTTLQRET